MICQPCYKGKKKNKKRSKSARFKDDKKAGKINDSWEKLQMKVMKDASISFDDFLRYFFLSEYGVLKSKSGIVPWLKNKVILSLTRDFDVKRTGFHRVGENMLVLSKFSEEIEKNGFVLTPGRYVGAPEEDDDGEPFDQKMKRLTSLLKEQQEEGAKLDQQIAENLKNIGYSL